ncbi:MAG: CDGSH iron-sulfur domain-containing protein, partial [Planctomycetes bacterium]|nr:CDGSH iron-sulfur domain-containing protein [Planctomycetota bacterium]
AAKSRVELGLNGRIPVECPQGDQYEVRNRVTLCRCGESKNQPYCDASHYECECMKGMDE